MSVFAVYQKLNSDTPVEVREFENFAAYSDECRSRQPFAFSSWFLGERHTVELGEDGPEEIYLKVIELGDDIREWYVHDSALEQLIAGDMELVDGEWKVLVATINPGVTKFEAMREIIKTTAGTE